MNSAREKNSLRETWRPTRPVSDVVRHEELSNQQREADEFETVPPSRHDKPNQRRSFRIPPLNVPKF